MAATRTTSRAEVFSKTRLLVTTIIICFHLQNTSFDWEYLLTHTQYMKLLAFLGDAVLKSYVVTELIGRGGICCAGLCTRTESYITNKNLSIIFDKLSFETAISWTVPSFFGIGRPSAKLMGTLIESMLGCTETYRPERTHEVDVSLMEFLEESNFGKPKAADCCAIKVGKPKACVQTCLGKLVTSQRAHAKAATTKDTMLVKHPLAECRRKAVTEVATPNGQQKPRGQKHAKQQIKSNKKRRSERLLGVQGGIRKKSKCSGIHV